MDLDNIDLGSFLSTDAHWNVNKKLGRMIGILPTILLMELIFCSIKYGEPEFYESVEKLDKILGVGADARRSAMKILVDQDLISVVKKGQPARYFYKIHKRQIVLLLLQMPSTSDAGGGSTGDAVGGSTSDPGDGTTYNKNINKNKEIKNNNRTEVEPLEGGEPIDFEFIKSEFTNFYKSKHPNSPPPKIHFITVEQIAKIEGLERHHFLEKLQAYYDNPWRIENKRPFSLEGLYAGWNFIEMQAPTTPLPELEPPPPKREESKQELYERLTQGFSTDTKDQLSAVLKFDGDTLVAFAQNDGRIGVIAKNLLDKINT